MNKTTKFLLILIAFLTLAFIKVVIDYENILKQKDTLISNQKEVIKAQRDALCNYKLINELN